MFYLHCKFAAVHFDSLPQFPSSHGTFLDHIIYLCDFRELHLITAQGIKHTKSERRYLNCYLLGFTYVDSSIHIQFNTYLLSNPHTFRILNEDNVSVPVIHSSLEETQQRQIVKSARNLIR